MSDVSDILAFAYTTDLKTLDQVTEEFIRIRAKRQREANGSSSQERSESEVGWNCGRSQRPLS